MSIKLEEQRLQRRFRLLINRVRNDHELFDKEVGALMELRPDQIHLVGKMRSGDATIHTCRIIKLSKNLIQEYDDSSVLQELVPDGCIVSVCRPSDHPQDIQQTALNLVEFAGQLVSMTKEDDISQIEVINKLEQIASECATAKEGF